MAFTPNLTTTFLVLTLLVVFLPVETYAFGAGDIPDFAYLNDKAFRHGDIENILETLVKSAGGAAAGGGLLGFAHSMLKQAAGGSKFSKSDVKKVYFGNWLRDYSQAMDIAGLSKLTAESLILVVSVLGFMTFGFATEEFQVTANRLGVYLPVEHIDNPKGYAAKEGDARQFHPKLRPPVNDRELEFDERTGMKNYMATEDQGWDSSTAFIRRTFRACIEAGRRAGGSEGADLWEAYRLLGTGLHTMEDLLAHSNWCEVALRKMGHEEVFCHVGDDVIINTPNGPAPPLITGTFGGADFIHSLMGEATDKLSQASVTDLSAKMNDASQGDQSNVSALKNILSKLPIGGSSDDKVNQGEEIHAQSKAYNFDPDNIAPPEVQQQLIALLKWRDGIYRDVLEKIEMVPGLSDLIEELTNDLNAYVYTVLSPYIAPILQQATGVLGEGSKAVIDSEDQFEVFNNPNASDPTHSFLSKDHFDLILNEPAGKIAQLVVEHSVNLIVPAWSNDSNPDEVITQILEAFHHPYYATGRSNIQHAMFDHMERWIGGLGPDNAEVILRSLTKDSVRNGKNKRPGSENEAHDEAGYGGHSHSHGASAYKPANSGGGYNQSQHSGSRTETSYGQDNNSARRQDYDSSNTYGGEGRTTYGDSQETYGSRRSDNDNSYSRSGYGGQTEDTSGHYGRSQHKDDSNNTYGSGRRTHESGGYGRSDTTSGRDDYSNSGRQSHQTYGEPGTDNSYGRSNDSSSGRGGYGGYGSSERTSGYGEEPQQTYGESAVDSSYGRSNDSGRGGYGEEPQQTYRESAVDSSYGRSSDSGRGGYGGSAGGGYGRESQQEGYGSGRHSEHGGEESGGYAPSYGAQAEARRGGYGEENTHSGGRRHESSGGGEYGSSGYGRTEEASYGSSQREGQEYGSSGYGGRGQYESSSGYAPSYGGGNEETFGAERLNISRGDDEDGEDRHHGRHNRHHGRSQDEDE